MTNRTTILPTLLVIASLLVLIAPAARAQQGKRYGLLIGVETYDPVQLTRLNYAEDDVEQLGRVLEGLGYEVIVMTSQSEIPARKPSTAEKILAQLGQRTGSLRREDTLVVAFSGHGVQFESDPADADGSKELFFCPEEADLQDRSTLVPMNRVLEIVSASAAGRKLLLVDACRNEVQSQLQKAATLVRLEAAGRNPRHVPAGMAALLSCSSGERSFEHPDLQHGVFFSHVLKYLEGRAETYPRDQLSVRALSSYASLSTSDYVFRRLNRSQSPELISHGSDWSLGPRPGQVIKHDLGIHLVLIRAGRLMMGSRESPESLATLFRADGETAERFTDQLPLHQVHLTRPFFMSAHEITKGQFRAFVEATGYVTDLERAGTGAGGFSPADAYAVEDRQGLTWRQPGHQPSGEDQPVVLVSWNDANAFCQWLSRRDGARYRLPTEAEWEYACRAGTATRYWTGDDPNSLVFGANVPDASFRAAHPRLDYQTIDGRDGYVGVSPVGTFRANPFGLYDMHGNVWEWCLDAYDPDFYSRGVVEDPLATSGSELRVIRGGCYM